jgi:hypothetical protein
MSKVLKNKYTKGEYTKKTPRSLEGGKKNRRIKAMTENERLERKI